MSALTALKGILAGIISGGSGPAAPVFDEFDAAVERDRGSWYTINAGPVDAARRVVETTPELLPEQEELLAELRRAWAATPALRLLQLLKNAIDRPEGKRLDKARVFYYEDAALGERLREWVQEREGLRSKERESENPVNPS